MAPIHWFDKETKNNLLDFSPAFMMSHIVPRGMSPDRFNPTNLNPLGDALVGVAFGQRRDIGRRTRGWWRT